MPNFLYSPSNAGPVTISGVVSRIYTAAANFSAGVLDAEDGRQIRFSGNFLAVMGEALTLTGQWQTHPKYGDQFMADGLGDSRLGESRGRWRGCPRTLFARMLTNPIHIL